MLETILEEVVYPGMWNKYLQGGKRGKQPDELPFPCVHPIWFGFLHHLQVFQGQVPFTLSSLLWYAARLLPLLSPDPSSWGLEF